jgi:hypothetical protein
MIQPTSKVLRTQELIGYSIPGIIHNGGYYFVNLSVYEDGRVECWNFEDFEHFKADVRRGWVALGVPEGDSISVFSLGSWQVTNGDWLFDRESFIAYVESLIQQLNPKMENIFRYSPKYVNGVQFGESGKGSIYKEEQHGNHGFFHRKVIGEPLNLFLREEGAFHLVEIRIFSDESIQLKRMEYPVELTFAELQTWVAEGRIVSEIPSPSRVHIHGLGSFTATSTHGSVHIHDKILEIKDIIRKLRGEPSTIELCVKAYEQYLKQPNMENRDKLRIAYETIPTHERMFVGDMDIKDHAVRMVIYGEQEIENWSHYQVANAMGLELPSIHVPRPEDEEE